ncbi:MAG: endo alpha-1,4 polygalactosaminidase [Solirubrobacterales bacterium]|nr:endo alpha-1,4 polygalactosaminidase [Solirubrobacterales bacterium]
MSALSPQAMNRRISLIRPLLALTAIALLGPIVLANSAQARTGDSGIWAPKTTTAPWQWQLQDKIDTSIPAPVYDVDGFETSRATVRTLHAQGRKVICYLDVGSWEPYRPDKAEFPRSVIGRRYAGFENERWLDISRFHLFEAPLKARIAMCAGKEFDAVEPDNVAGWEPENKTGFKITRADQLRFNRWIARQVHSRGMAVALKNDGRQAAELAPDFDFAIVEECFHYHECGYYKNAFVAKGKAVFEAEYEQEPKAYCKTALAIGFSAIRKSLGLFAKPWRPCGGASRG